MSHNPFEEANNNNNNPWSDGGPRYGNAYESSPGPELPPRVKETPTLVPSSPYGTQRMPSPSDYHQPQPPVNAWQQQESNKTLDEPVYNNTNAYQYSGTPYGNSPTVASAYSPQPTHTENINTTNNDNNKAESINIPSATRATPSKLRVLFRVILFIFAIGHLGFAAGASPVIFFSILHNTLLIIYYVVLWRVCSF